MDAATTAKKKVTPAATKEPLDIYGPHTGRMMMSNSSGFVQASAKNKPRQRYFISPGVRGWPAAELAGAIVRTSQNSEQN